ncbi:MAG: deoxyuridine 5'-triphosphate nucleotidohydrolase [Candidatus Binatia bacterium]|nr:MAG: deoxyuridine 5'-triphosphate nucleotidohydrolase [Candidatus Binatia bacterium]
MTEPVVVRVRRVRPECRDLPLPRYMSPGAAGMDVCAAITEPLELRPGERALVPTGLALDVPEGYEAQIRPRSGLAWEAGITLLNSPGTIDSDYRGEVQILVVNLGEREFVIRRGDRIAQIVVAPVARAVLSEVDALAPTARGSAGFGATGRR